VDAGRTVATGHSRGGQAAIAAGIFDERFAVVVPCTGGFGSTGVLRIRDPNGVRGKIDYIADVLKDKHPHWHHERYHQFAGQQDRMPFDAHTLVALIAPRPLLNTNAISDQFNNRLSNEIGIRVGREIYRFWGAEEWCRIHWRPGKHAQREEDWTALLDFADEYFLGQEGASEFNAWQYPNFELPILWRVPDTSNTTEE
jgi:endo-1,4-beta-xylanase